MSLLTKRMLVVGILYTAVVEGLLANLPFSIRLLTVIYYARLIAYRTMDIPRARGDGGREDLAAEVWQLDPVRAIRDSIEHPQRRHGDRRATAWRASFARRSLPGSARSASFT